VRAVEAVTADDVRRVARTYLSAPTVVTLGPAAQ
jgi:predicted Zn-dependent peptidase